MTTTTTRKKLDARIKTLIENGINANHRSIFVVVGDKGRDQIPILYSIMAKCNVKPNPNVLWAYKKELGFSTNHKKRLRRHSKKIRNRTKDVNENNPIEVFVSSTKIRYCYYKEVQNIVGQTYGMCILQDFEALTPNIMAQTMETVEGGGMIVILLSTMKSLKQLCVMKMDVHARYRDASSNDVVGRFNERFILALSECSNCLVINDRLDVMPTTNDPPAIEPLPPRAKGLKNSADDLEMKAMVASLNDRNETKLAGLLVSCCATLDQGKAVLKMIDALANSTINSTVVMTAARGRGKSAALGLGLAAAVAYGYRNIYVTSPSPENLRTLFEYVKNGLTALEYNKNGKFKMILSSREGLSKTVVRVEVRRDGCLQTIQYIDPKEHLSASGADLVCIDEAAAIPMMHINNLFGAYPVFMSSTVDGYEGTGRSLSNIFISGLRQKVKRRETGVDAEKILQRLRVKSERSLESEREKALCEIELGRPIRYSDKDPVELWLKTLLCLDVRRPHPAPKCPPSPDACKLYYINRDTLFSFRSETEAFLQKLISMFVASHYKNSPNDVQMLSDAPNHHIFCLLGPTNKSSSNPTILCAIQIALEGELSREAVRNALRRGLRDNMDMISWEVDQQFLSLGFNKLSGARIVTVATHPDLQRKGYGKRAVDLLIKHLEGELNEGIRTLSDETEKVVTNVNPTQLIGTKTDLDAKLPPLLKNIDRVRMGGLDYIGVSCDSTYPVTRFFRKLGMVPVCVDTNMNPLTEEHNCIMLRTLARTDAVEEKVDEIKDWLLKMFSRFRDSFVDQLVNCCRRMRAATAVTLLSDKNLDLPDESKDCIQSAFRDFNLIGLRQYDRNMLDHTQIPVELMTLASLVLQKKIQPELNCLQTTVLLAVGLQNKMPEDLSRELESGGTKLGGSAVVNILESAIRASIKSLNSILGENSESTRIETGNANGDIDAETEENDDTKATLKRKADDMKRQTNKKRKVNYETDK